MTILHSNSFLYSECTWKPLGELVRNKGNMIGVKNGINNIKECQQDCEERYGEGCKSFSFCSKSNGKSCILYDKELNGTEAQVSSSNCYSNYRSCKRGNQIEIEMNTCGCFYF